GTSRLSDAHLVITDPSEAQAGITIAWSYPDSLPRPTVFEIYASLDQDSLGGPVAIRQGGDSLRAVLSVPDTVAPFTVFFAVRAVLIEPTGQRQYADTVPVDYLTIASPASVRTPA